MFFIRHIIPVTQTHGERIQVCFPTRQKRTQKNYPQNIPLLWQRGKPQAARRWQLFHEAHKWWIVTVRCTARLVNFVIVAMLLGECAWSLLCSQVNFTE